MRMLRTPPFLPPKSGEKPYLEIFSRFCFWRDFLITYKQQFLHSDWIKTCQLIPNQWNFTSATVNHIRFVFFYLNIKDNKRNLAKICCQLKTPARTWKCTRCIMQMSYLYASDFPFKNFCKIAQHTETIRKNVWEKGNNVYSLSIRVQTTIFYVFMFFTTISTPKKMFSFRARDEKGIARHIDASGVVGT